MDLDLLLLYFHPRPHCFLSFPPDLFHCDSCFILEMTDHFLFPGAHSPAPTGCPVLGALLSPSVCTEAAWTMPESLPLESLILFEDTQKNLSVSEAL